MLSLTTKVQEAGRIYKTYSSRLEKLGISTFEDFLYHIPSRYEDYSLLSKIESLQSGEKVTIQGSILEIKNVYTKYSKKLQKAIVTDGTGEVEITWYNQPFLTKYLKKGDKVSLSGRVGEFNKKITLEVPEYEVISVTNPQQTIHTGRLVPIYPETRGVSSKWLRRQVYKLLHENKEEIIDFLPQEIKNKNQFPDLSGALQSIHFPNTHADSQKARERLSFDELFFMQLLGYKRRESWDSLRIGSPFVTEKHEISLQRLIKSLPFELTVAQKKAFEDMIKDLIKTRPMNRMLQGDVGSGKTIVATLVMYLAHLNSYQSVFMAPTEILAEQHYKTISALLSPLGIKIALATGSKKIGIKNHELGKKRKNHDLSSIIPDSFDVLVGTHAVLSEGVKFTNLGLVVIDEQQRFGVEQRSVIRQKGNNPHVLTMTATPIPRTIALTLYGDLDVSYLHEMPKGRKKVKTWLVPQGKRDASAQWIREQIIKTDSQVFIICPFIEESESLMTVKAAVKEFERLKNEVFPDLQLGLLHGKMKAKDKEEVLQKFRDKKFSILVATPVVEVGIDIPNATIIVIEAAERFGLSQLHQLRGRVGRGEKQSFCLLFTESKNPQTITRLKAMETIHIGADLAELDLKLRGPGELYGIMQSGSRQLKIASFSDFDLIQKARNAAKIIYTNLNKYPALKEKMGNFENKNISPD